MFNILDVDVELSSVQYRDSELITRNVTGFYSFCVSLNRLSGLYPVVVLDGSDVNYNMYYFLSDTAQTGLLVIVIVKFKYSVLVSIYCTLCTCIYW